MSTSTLLFLVLILACPLMMLFMHRGGQHGGHGDQAGRAGGGCGHGGHSHDGHSHREEAQPSLDELRRQRDELDARIEDLERAETEAKTPARTAG